MSAKQKACTARAGWHARANDDACYTMTLWCEVPPASLTKMHSVLAVAEYICLTDSVVTTESYALSNIHTDVNRDTDIDIDI